MVMRFGGEGSKVCQGCDLNRLFFEKLEKTEIFCDE